MKKKVNFTAASSLYFVANLFNKGISFLTVPIFTRLLSTFEYGVVTTYSSWASILTAILGMSLNTAIRYSYVEKGENTLERKKEMSSIFSFTILIGLLAMVSTAVCVLLIPVSVNITMLILCFLQGIFNALITDYSTYQMMEYKYIGRSILMTLPNLTAAVLSVGGICLLREYRYMGRIIPLSLMTCLIGIIVCCMVYKQYRPCLDMRYLKAALIISVPLIVHGVALNILSQADRTMITALRNASETGIYSLVYSFSMIATVVTTSLEGIWVPWFTDKMNSKNYKDINKHGRDYLNLMTYAMVCLILSSVEILKVLADREYWLGIPIIPPIVLANYIIFIYTLFVNIEYYYKKTVFITFNTVIAAIANILLNFIFIPRFGFIAAAYTTLVSYFISFALHAAYSKRLDKRVFPIKIFVRPLFHLSVSTILFYYFMDEWFVRWGLMGIYFVLMIVRERKRIGEYFPQIAYRSSFFQ